MAKSVTTIPATLSRFTAAPINSTKKRRVAAYARVSTDNEEQLTSYEAQVDYYTNYIKGRDDWEFAGVYTDEGITGTNTKKREGFKSMVADALDGKIDLIITKSVLGLCTLSSQKNRAGAVKDESTPIIFKSILFFLAASL